MELTFVKNEKAGSYVAEFEVTADFNLHIEREKGGRILFYQKSQGAGGWAHIDDMGWQDGKPSIDYDFTALVYPKMIKIVSESEPTFASVATDGEVTEIKSQSKEIEVTANGTTVVEPDAGFAYLNKVSVKTNVEGQGGGSTGGGGSASSWRYFDFTAYSDDVLGFLESIPSLMHTMRIVINGKDAIVPMGTIMVYNITEEHIKNIKAVGADMSALVKNHPLAPNATTMAEVYSTDIGGMTIEQGIKDYWKLPEITKEEFYNLES